MSELAQALTAEIDGLEGRNRSHVGKVRAVARRSCAAGLRFLRAMVGRGSGCWPRWAWDSAWASSPRWCSAAARPRRMTSGTTVAGRDHRLRQRAVQILTQALQAPAPELRRMASLARGRAGEVSARTPSAACCRIRPLEVRAQAARAWRDLATPRRPTSSDLAGERQRGQRQSRRCPRPWRSLAMRGARFLRQALESSASRQPIRVRSRLRAAFLLCDGRPARRRTPDDVARAGRPTGCGTERALGLSQAAVASATRQLLAGCRAARRWKNGSRQQLAWPKAREPQALAFLRQLSRDSGPHQLLAARWRRRRSRR